MTTKICRIIGRIISAILKTRVPELEIDHAPVLVYSLYCAKKGSPYQKYKQLEDWFKEKSNE